MIIDAHDIVRKGLAILLESFGDFEVITDIDNGQIGLKVCQKYQSDVVLMDILMPGLDAL